jgi:hypothetical protein
LHRGKLEFSTDHMGTVDQWPALLRPPCEA